MDYYFEKVHFWFPFLDPTLVRQKFVTLTPSSHSEHCMFMMIMALGSLAEREHIWNDQEWADGWAQPAFSLLPEIITQNDLTAVHCLILFRYVSRNRFRRMLIL
jgi:hypothetical protein